VKRHHASSSGPRLGSPLVTATRSPLWQRRSAAIKSGNRPEANVLLPASSSTCGCVIMSSTIVLAPRNPRWPTERSEPNPASRSWPRAAYLGEFVCSAPVIQRSTRSAIASASSTSIPRYRTVLSIFVWTARRLPVRRYFRVAFVRRGECVPNRCGSKPIPATHYARLRASITDHWAGGVLSKAEFHFPAVAQTLGFGLRRSKMPDLSMGID
jgi:hypothetical protein